MSVSLLERLFARVPVSVGEGGVPRQAGTPPAPGRPMRLGVGVDTPIYRPPSIQVQGGVSTTSGIRNPAAPPRPYDRLPGTPPPYTAPQPTFRTAPGLPNAAETLQRVQQSGQNRSPRYTPPSARPSDRYSPALTREQIATQNQFNRRVEDLNRIRERFQAPSRTNPRYAQPAPAPLNLGQAEQRAREFADWQQRQINRPFRTPSALPGDRYSPALTREQIGRNRRLLEEMTDGLINRTRAFPGSGRAIPRSVSVPRPRIPAIRPRPGLLRSLGGGAITLGRALIPEELFDPVYRPREALIDRLSGPPDPRMEPFADPGAIIRDGVPAEIRSIAPGAGIGADLGRIAGSWLSRRLLDLLFGPQPSPGDQLGHPPLALPPPPIVGEGRWMVRVNIIWFGSYSHLSGEAVMEFWGPLERLQWGDENIPEGAPLRNVGVFYEHHGFPGAHSHPLISTVSSFLNAATNNLSAEGTFGYRIWPSSEPEPNTPFIPAPQPDAGITSAAPPYPLSPIPPPSTLTPEVPSVPGTPPAIAPPGVPTIPAIRPSTVPTTTPSTVPTSPTSPGYRLPPGRSFNPPALNPPPLQTPTRTTRITITGGDPLNCRFTPDPFTQSIKSDTQLTNQKLDQIMGLLGDAAIMGKLNVMDRKLGPQLTGGISGVLKKFAESQLMQNFINMLTFVTALHNAMMLSSNITQTLFSAFDLIYELPGLGRFRPTDPETGEPTDYGSWASAQFDSLVRSAFGDHTVNTVRRTWLKASTIYRAATNLLFSIQSLMHTLMELQELTNRYTAWIGNALKKFGVVGEYAYPWMNPNLKARKLNRILNALEEVEEGAETVEAIAANTVEVTQTIQMMDEQQAALSNAIKGLDANGQPFPGQEEDNTSSVLPHTNAPEEPAWISASEGAQTGQVREFGEAIGSNDEQRPLTGE